MRSKCICSNIYSLFNLIKFILTNVKIEAIKTKTLIVFLLFIFKNNFFSAQNIFLKFFFSRNFDLAHFNQSKFSSSVYIPIFIFNQTEILPFFLLFSIKFNVMCSRYLRHSIRFRFLEVIRMLFNKILFDK